MKKFLSLLLALCLVVGMVPLAASAEKVENCQGGDSCQHAAAIGTTHYDTLAEALNAAVDGNTVVVLRKTTIGEPAKIDDGKIVLDMNGQTVSYVPSKSNEALGIIDIAGTASVTVTGNGSFDYTNEYYHSSYNEYGYIFRVQGNANLTIENGDFHAVMTCVQVGQKDPNTVATATIAGGTYSADVLYNDTYWHLNLIDYNAAKPEEDNPDRIIVTGGTFVNYDPSQSKTENPVANFVADGYTVVQNGEKYVVQALSAENAVAQVGDNFYESLRDAIESAASGAHIVLLKDYTAPDLDGAQNEYNLPDNCILDLNGKTLTVPFMEAIFQGKGATIQNGVITSNADYPLFIGNGSNATDITIENVEVKGGINVYVATVTLVDVIADATEKKYHAVWGDEASNIIIQSGTFSANPSNNSSMAIYVFGGDDSDGTDDGPDDHGNISILGGNVNGKIGVSNWEEGAGQCLTAYAGYFTSDPSGYLAEGKAAVESDKAGYNYMVAAATTTPAEVVPAAPEANVNPALTGENKTAAEAIQNALTPETVTGDGVSAAANSVANQNTVTANDEVLAKLNAAIGQGGTQATDQNTTIVVQPYMDIAIEDVDTQAQTVTLEITPMYRTVATTADVEQNGDIVLEADPAGGATVNAVQIGEEKPLTITKPVTMTLTLPDGFKSQTVYIQHKGYEYSAAAGSDGKVTFTNPHGFSSFTFDTTSHAVAKIEGTSYTSLQDAVNHVQDGQTITLLKDGQSATVDREVSFIIGNEGGNAYKAVLAPGSGYTMTEGENGQYTFTKKVTPGPGGEEEDGFPFTDVKTSDWYYDAVKYVYENGLMAGTSETTFAPEVKLNRAMAVQILYNLEGKPAVTEAATFTDAAAAGEWALDAIAWAQQTGVVAGMGDNLFAPAAQVTREQFAQMMYNYAKYKGYDLTAAGDLAQFTDSGKLQSWAVTAMKWANGNGLINGFEDNTLQPAGTTIRGQAASIIMNFDKNVAK
ncbi:MAG: S-layer homology domain-containing protein [Acutalibacter sp.]